MDFILES